MNVGFCGYVPGYVRMNPEIVRGVKRFLACIVLLCAVFLTGHVVCQAAEGTELTDLFYTSAFSGSWEVFSKFNWLGKLMNFLISAFCLIGLFMIAFRLVITLLYKSNEALFDRIYDLKQTGKGQKFFGFGAMGREVLNGNFGVGSDAIVGFVLSLAPNVKAYSDYNPEKMLYNLSDDDTMTTYVLKISLPTIFAVFFFAIGFNGTLLQGYGAVANAMARGASKLVSVDLAASVDKIMGSGSYYSFSFDTSNELGKLQKSTANSIYTKLLFKMDDISQGNMLSLGSSVQSWVMDNITAANLNAADTSANSQKIDPGRPETLKYAKNYSVSVILNTNTEKYNNNDHYAAVSSLGVSSGNGQATQYTLHCIISKKANADETDYFSVDDGSGDSATATDKPATIHNENGGGVQKVD